MEQYEHIILPEQIRTAIEFSPRTKGGSKPNIPIRDRAEHAARLERLFEDARVQNEKIKKTCWLYLCLHEQVHIWNLQELLQMSC